MLKTNSKQAIENIKKYILDNYDPSNYDEDEAPTEGFEKISSFILATARNEYSHLVNRVSDEQIFNEWCYGLPSLLDTCFLYNRSAVEDLGNILEETQEERSKYTETASEKQLIYLMYRELKKGEAHA